MLGHTRVPINWYCIQGTILPKQNMIKTLSRVYVETCICICGPLSTEIIIQISNWFMCRCWIVKPPIKLLTSININSDDHVQLSISWSAWFHIVGSHVCLSLFWPVKEIYFFISCILVYFQFWQFSPLTDEYTRNTLLA